MIITSVLLAWNLSRFDEWTTWSLLTLLALYDIFAVLSPCGPLRALVDMMKSRPTESLPGLLYEAHLTQPRGTSSREEVEDNPLRFGVNSNIISEGRVSVTGTARSSRFRYHINGDEDPNNFDGVFDEGNDSSPSNTEILRPTQIGDGMDAVTTEGSQTTQSFSAQNAVVKLGLGDFVFYSLLVSRAAIHGFRLFVICFFVILGVSFPPYLIVASSRILMSCLCRVLV